MIEARTRGTGYGRLAVVGLAMALATLPAEGRAGSVAYQSVRFGQAVTMSARVVNGPVRTISGEDRRRDVPLCRDRRRRRAEGAAREGRGARPAFDGAPWFQHTHAAAIKAGVVSYAEAHYATPLPAAEIKPGAVVIVFLPRRGAAPRFSSRRRLPFPCGGCFERPDRAADVSARMKTAAFGDPITLAMGEVAVWPDGLEVEVKGHTRKRAIGGGTGEGHRADRGAERNAERAVLRSASGARGSSTRSYCSA